ncbi:MAG TPA: exosortase/archaeosortase family protein [Fimbriimonadaceae bacterium]|jgi:exosortase
MQIAEGVHPSRKVAKLKKGFNWFSIASSEGFWPAVLIALGISAIFWGLFTFTYGKWSESEGYYTHGFLVPFISGYIVYRWWPKLKQNKVKAGWAAIPFMLATLWIAYAATRTDIYSILSLLLIIMLLLSIWFIAGWRWMLALLAPTLYLLFALPVWDQAINNYTTPLQLLSTKMAFHMLQAFFMHPKMEDTTTILLGSYHLEVAVACSGFKLLLALVAFGAFFMLIAKLKWWANAIFAASIIPIALVMNGLRIAMVGVVGHTWGFDAGAKFHDYSGYIVIILCFLLMNKWAKILGYNKNAVEPDYEVAPLSEVGKKSLKTRAFAVGALLTLTGGILYAAPKPKPLPGRTEAWMESIAPSLIGDYKVTSTYKMEPSTYSELQPYGIVCRIFGNGKESYDVTLVASNRKSSFHDPRVCFPAQDQSIDDQHQVLLQTATRGVIPITVISMTEGDTKNKELAAFFYRGPKGFYATPQALSWAMLKDQFFGTNDEGVFYRFMPQNPNATEDQMEAFIKEYMDQSGKISGGFF